MAWYLKKKKQKKNEVKVKEVSGHDLCEQAFNYEIIIAIKKLNARYYSKLTFLAINVTFFLGKYHQVWQKLL